MRLRVQFWSRESKQTGLQSIAEGVEMRMLRISPAGGMTFLIRMQKGACAPLHDHPGGEETYLLEGRLRIQSRLDADRRPARTSCSRRATTSLRRPAKHTTGSRRKLRSFWSSHRAEWRTGWALRKSSDTQRLWITSSGDGVLLRDRAYPTKYAETSRAFPHRLRILEERYESG